MSKITPKAPARKQSKSTVVTKTVNAAAPLRASVDAPASAMAQRLIPRIGITPDRARALAAHCRRLPHKLYGAAALKEEGVVLYEEFGLLVGMFTSGEFEDNVVAFSYRRPMPYDASRPDAEEFTVTELGAFRDGFYYDPIEYADAFGCCVGVIEEIPRLDATGADRAA